MCSVDKVQTTNRLQVHDPSETPFWPAHWTAGSQIDGRTLGVRIARIRLLALAARSRFEGAGYHELAQSLGTDEMVCRRSTQGEASMILRYSTARDLIGVRILHQ